ncbi:OLC1v1018871C1 [Oldenlandia corymbosa var. corymbosa]|uniref:OLC1v1018871C1 n=1 Tax=Oldenlandia corymbosa var. corymbosa TaxID=529605 RepID=A0AAV1ED09_OLDCO|nr:OLC1v1018871C1 [Oldenlandia corymbosa var. corymbosa]
MEVTLEELKKKMADFAQERDWDQFHSPRNLLLALVGEVGELSEIFQWKGEVPRGLPDWRNEEKQHLGEELSDVLLYLVRLSDICGIDLGKAVLRKLELNAQKYPVDLCKGSSEKLLVFFPYVVFLSLRLLAKNMVLNTGDSTSHIYTGVVILFRFNYQCQQKGFIVKEFQEVPKEYHYRLCVLIYLAEMDARVKSMIKLTEEDAESFTRRAEMSYKKHREIMKMVEEFYRAYSALAERYDYAPGSLENLSAVESQIPRVQEDSKGLSEQASQDEAEREGNLLQYCHRLEKISGLEDSVSHAEKDAEELNQRAIKATTELNQLKTNSLKYQLIKMQLLITEKAENKFELLKQSIAKLTEEKEAAELEYHQCMETISRLEE